MKTLVGRKCETGYFTNKILQPVADGFNVVIDKPLTKTDTYQKITQNMFYNAIYCEVFGI